MADDMRREVSALPWVGRVEVTLGEHMYADKINHGLAHGLSFRDTFGNDASAELDELRRTFLVKAFQRRQEALLRYLLKQAPQGVDGGPSPAMTVSTMTLQALKTLPLDADGDQIRRRYLDRRHICAAPGEPLAFVDAQGEPIAAESLRGYLQALGRVTINAEFNGALCRGLLAARFNEDGEPSLADFARMPWDRIMPKMMLHDDAARKALGRGVAQLAKAVRGTLGPRGMNAIMDRPVGTPIISRDGVSIAAEVELEDPFENMGAQVVREVSMKTNEVVGDGTTTATVLADAMIQQGLAALDCRRQPGRTGARPGTGRGIHHYGPARLRHPAVRDAKN